MKNLGSIAVILFLIVLIPNVAYGCSCTQPTQADEFKNSRTVIIGRFIEETDKGSKFRVIRSWKGAKVNKIIYLNLFVLDCGLEVNFVKDKDFLLYVPSKQSTAWAENNSPTIWFVCGRSKEAEDAQEDIENMDKISTENKKQ